MTDTSPTKENLARRIAGEILLSKMPGATVKKWRETFEATQTTLAEELQIAPSVISDYEGGRRTPGARFIRRFVRGLISFDEQQGGHALRALGLISKMPSDAVIGIREFPIPIRARAICETVDGRVVANESRLESDIYGYTIVDSVRLVEDFSGTDFYQLFGSTTERAAVFTNVSTGRSPMVAVRVHPLKPRMVVIHGPRKVDALAVNLARLENIPLVLSRLADADDLVHSLNSLYHRVVERTNAKTRTGTS
jgi:putative transcriptional regulator